MYIPGTILDGEESWTPPKSTRAASLRATEGRAGALDVLGGVLFPLACVALVCLLCWVVVQS